MICTFVSQRILVIKISQFILLRWYKSNLLVGNLKKYQTLKIGYRTETTGSERASGGSCINNEEIKTAETLKLLGLTIDFRLKYSEHVNSACKEGQSKNCCPHATKKSNPY